MKKTHAQILVLAAALLLATILRVDIPFVRGIGWSSETQLTTHPKLDMSPSIMQAQDGTIWVAWSSNRLLGNDELYYATSSDYGLSWSPDTRLTNAPSYDQCPSIMQSNNGTIWAVWASYRTGNYDLFCKTFNGLSWSSDIQLTTEPSLDIDPSIMQAANGSILLVWHSERTGNSDLFYKTYNGSAWSADTQLTSDSSSDKYPSIEQTDDGTIWVVWASNRTVNFDLFYKTFNGTAWSSDTQLTIDAEFDMSPSIAQARDGAIWVVWQSDRPSGLQDELYYKVYDGSAWSSDTQLTNDQANDIAPSIFQIDDRKIWVVWATDRDTLFDIYYKTSNEIINHDVAIASVTPSALRANQGEIISISVVAENQGDESETFDVTLYANDTTISSTPITLANGTSTVVGFLWNTTGIETGIYTMSAEASAVPNEIDIKDNMHGDGRVMVAVPGDVNGDGKVDSTDLTLVTDTYGAIDGHVEYESWPWTDLNVDGIIDIHDLEELGENYG